MRMLDLFSGIGGFALAGKWVWGDDLDIVGFCEIEEFAQKVLKKNFPGVPIYDDITKLDGNQFNNIDILTGGFPCQDISLAGKGKGLVDEKGDKTRSGLWFEMHRIIREVRPRFALIENVPMLTIRGGTRVIADIASIGYDCEWTIIGADDVGARHRRKRIWIVAYEKEYPNTNSDGCDYGKRSAKKDSKRITGKGRMEGNQFAKLYRDVSDTEQRKREMERNNARMGRIKQLDKKGESRISYWKTEPELGRVANGIPNRMDRLKGIGNAIVPQVAELIMNRIKKEDRNA